MNPAMSLPEVRWFVRGPKVAIFEMPAVDIDVSHLGPPPPASHRRIRADQTEEIHESDILAEFPAEVAVERTQRLPRVNLAFEDEETRPAIAPYRPRLGWMIAIIAGTIAGIVLAIGLSFYARAPIARTARAQIKAVAAAKSLAPSAAARGVVVPTVSVYNLPRAR